MHEHKIAHLDLKPNNVVVTSQKGSSTRLLSIIDFGISVFVEGVETEVEGYRGTPCWVAPEVGSEDGPRRRYSVILADRWACGQMIEHLGEYLINWGVSWGEDFRTLSRPLLKVNPVARPPLMEVL
ncbi:kinase-like domain-containing protein, partial [Multifurca ochricompacta]